ncbi:TPA: hypothetical protein NHJ50_002379 [Legionella pneumophila]|nr:hypothetical protein [Legionella pneumophila]
MIAWIIESSQYLSHLQDSRKEQSKEGEVLLLSSPVNAPKSRVKIPKIEAPFKTA